jgi:hypothetical protein
MTISDIALFATQRLTDNANGGGQLTANIIPDNQANNLFGPISRIARADGNVSLRKAIAKARAATTQTFFGAHAIVAAPPANPDVSVLMFSTDSWTDVRSQAADFIESYLVQGPQTRMWAYGQQVIGARSIIVYQPPSEPLPNIGETYVLVNQQATPNVTQFVRVTSISQRVQTFTDTIGTFQLNIITLGISDRLKATFPGAQVQRFSAPSPPSLLCITNVANAATYFGCETLTTDVASGDEVATLNSVFGQLLPSTQGEAPINDAIPSGAAPIVATASARVDLGGVAGTLFDFTAGKLYLPRGAMPGSVIVTSSVAHTDDGAGNIPSIGTIDYATGVLSSSYGGAVSVSYIPAVQVSEASFSAQQPVTESTRGYVYTQTFTPLPSPGTTMVSYRALGRWFDLRDDGTGTLVGPEGAGVGTVRFDSGNCTVTLGALPDIGSNVVFTWGGSSQFDIRTGDTSIQIPAILLTLTNPAKPSTVTITWLVGVTTKTVTDNGAGVLSGDGVGTIDYGSGIINLRPTALPSPATGISVAYQTNPATTQNLTPSKSGSTLNFTLSGGPIVPHSVAISYSVPIPTNFPASFAVNSSNSFNVLVTDNGSGGLVSDFGITGTINYTTGAVSFDPDVLAYSGVAPVYAPYVQDYWDSGTNSWMQRTISILIGWDRIAVTAAFVNGSAVTAISTPTSATPAAHTDSFPVPAAHLDLTPATVQPIVAGSVMFAFAGDTYIDRAGSLYRAINAATNAGTLAGAIDYDTGIVTITNWPTGGGTSTVSIKALLCQSGLQPIGNLSARVPGQSVRPSSFQIQANRGSDSALITATADVNGNWSTAGMTGHIDVTTGFYSVSFGQLVLDSSLTSDDKAEPWYDSGNVDGTGHIWRPDEALPGTVKYSCVVETILPLSAGVLGLDPVRLPQDGRVQIISAGNTLCFRNPLVYSVSPTPSAGATITLPRGSLESAVLYDANAVQVDTSQYTIDLATGVITMSPASGAVAPQANFDLSAYTAPYSVTHTRGELVLCTDAEITGQISFSPGLVHAYPAASSFVSSCLIADNSGNLQADYDTKFQQTTWNFDPNNLWDDVVHGSSPTPVYDDLNYPIQVLDRDCISQRVAFIFTSSTGGNIAFEELGIVGTFDTSHNAMPINPATSGETTTTSGSFVIAAVGATQSVSVASAADLETIDYCVITDGTHSIKGVITAISGSTLTFRTIEITTGAAGNTMASGAVLTVANPYFVLDWHGWGTGWASQNALRVNFHGCGFPIWFARSVQVGASETADDSFLTELRWDE